MIFSLLPLGEGLGMSVRSLARYETLIGNLRYVARPTPVVLRVTLQTSNLAIALTTKVTRKRINPSSISELR